MIMRGWWKEEECGVKDGRKLQWKCNIDRRYKW
jgi:hypothetical protein